jgi:hypothetical protein
MLPILSAAEVLRVSPVNPRYLEWKGQPTVLIGSGEHYGALVNLDFDFQRYFNALKKDGLNVTRIFSGATYVEPPGAFHIEKNTLAPPTARYLSPWAKTERDGVWNLDGWNEDYFMRLRALVAAADDAGVIVEFCFFCPFYPDANDKSKSPMWPLSPLHPENRVTDIGATPHDRVYTLDADPRLLAAQERFIRRVVSELKVACNVYYEVCNEPYIGGVTMAWQHRMVDVIMDAQREHPMQKLISLNIANKTARVEQLHPAVSLINFHYTYPPVAVRDNWHLQRPIGNNETGFRGQRDEVYRNEAWDWMLAGGATFNHLDYSFAVGHEDGGFDYPETQPGGGSRALRKQLAVLRDFMDDLPFIHMRPANELVSGLAKGASIHLLAQPGEHYAAYLHHSGKHSKELTPGQWRDTFTIEAPAGRYRVEWVDVTTGQVIESQTVQHLRLKTPLYETEIALRIQPQR